MAAVETEQLAGKADEINRLRGQIALQHEMLAPLALSEKAGMGRPRLWPSGKADT